MPLRCEPNAKPYLQRQISSVAAIFTKNIGIPYLLKILGLEFQTSPFDYILMLLKLLDELYTVLIIPPNKRMYPYNIFLIYPRKNMSWVLIRSTSAWKYEYFLAEKKSALSGAI